MKYSCYAAVSILLKLFSGNEAFILQDHNRYTIRTNSRRLENDDPDGQTTEKSINHHVPLCTRRSLFSIFISSYLTTIACTFDAYAAFDSDFEQTYLLNDDFISTLTYQKTLGRGAFKTVYLVSSGSTDSPLRDPKKWALAVERVASKSDSKAGLHGIRIAEELQGVLAKKDESNFQDCFEKVEQWWFQSASLPEFQTNTRVFPGIKEGDRTQVVPRKYLGRSKFLIALKPLYDIDLRRFAETMPLRYPIGSTLGNNSTRVLAGIDLNDRDSSAFRLAYEVCEVGRVMHAVGLVHRDIKPRNIMLHNGGRPVFIDFGFAEFVDMPRGSSRRCIEEPGKMKGEKGYMLAKDAALFQGCTEGDAYAAGKTLYETIFGPVAKAKVLPASSSSDTSSSGSSSSTSGLTSSSSSGKMTVETIRVKEKSFRKLLASDRAGKKSRFILSNNGRATLLHVIRGLCQEQNPMSFEEAQAYLKPEVKIDLSPG